ncbi:hypothetical protein [Virgibacillus ainsalahensis]
MGERAIYLLFTDTGTYLNKAINYYTKQSLNHVSIAFDSELKEVYSFGRKHPRNPFAGGFIKEDIRCDLLKKSNCAVYAYMLTAVEHQTMMRHIKKMEAEKHNYKYNFIGLIGVLLHIEINRQDAFFCSQFVASLLKNLGKFRFEKPPCFITPADIRMHEGMQLIYQGKLGDYQDYMMNTQQNLAIGQQTTPKQSMLISVSAKVKQFVLK